jgi:putative ABC transport system permease protein
MHFLLDLAWRDLKASGRSLWVFCACLTLGVALVATTGGLYQLLNQGLLADTRILLGGDLEVDAESALPEAVLDWMHDHGDVSLVTEMDTMLGTTNDEFLRVEIQAMDASYPLYGVLTLQPDLPLADITAFRDGQWGAAIDPVLADTLGIGVGDDIYIGSLTMRVRALVLQQPDRALSAEWRGTPVLVNEQALEPSGLILPGSRLDFDYRVRTPTPANEWRQKFYSAFPEGNWDVRTFRDRSRRIAERLDQLASGLLIIAFSTLFIGGLGVFNSIQTYLQRKLKTIATIRALGLRNRRLAAVYLLQVAIMSGGASVVGAISGAGLAWAAAGIIASEIPMATTAASLVPPMLIAVIFGMLTAFSFALPAVGRALSVQPATLFRGTEAHVTEVKTGWWLAALACAAIIVSLVLLALPDKLFGLGFIATVAGVLLLFDMIVRGIRSAARRLDDHPALTGRFNLRLALANLHRPGTPLRATLLSLGSALTLLVACTMVVLSLLRTINETIPEESPALVLYDIANHQLEDVVEAIGPSLDSVRVDTTPLVRSRIVSVNGVEVSDLQHLSRARRRDMSQDDYDLSYSANNIDDVTITSGAWWTETRPEPPRLALEDREAERTGLQVGDVVTLGIAGNTVTTQVDAIFSQKGMQTRFWFEGIVSDGALDGMIFRHVGAAYMTDTEAIDAQRRIGRVAPNVVTVRTASLLTSARDILGKAAVGLGVIAGISLLASLLVLVSVMAAGRSRQIYDATVLHALGTRMAVIRRSLQLEYVLLGVTTAALAVLLGAMIAMPLLTLRLKLPVDNLLWSGIGIAAAVSGLSLNLGARYLLRRLRVRPAVLLRGGG